MLEQIFKGVPETQGRVDKILTLIKKLSEIESAMSTLRYNDELMMEIPEVFKTLGAAKDAVIAELKTV
jgi:hypothetical protein